MSDQYTLPEGITELKPCPFCKGGGFSVTGLYFTDERKMSISCDCCQSEGPFSGIADDGLSAARMWNSRRGSTRLFG